MAETTPELRAAIDVAKERINVESYYPRAMNAGLKGNAQGFWSGTVLGMATGALGGGLVWAGLAAAVASGAAIGPAAAFMGWPLILGMAGIGGTMGGATGARIGAGSGATAAVAAERERRDRGDKLEQEILASPEKQREVINAYRANPVVEKNDTAKEIFATTRGTGKAIGKFVNLPTFLICVSICALASMALFGGAFALGGGLTAGNVVASGLGAIGMSSMPAALGIGAGAGAAMGAAFGIAYPPIFAGITKTVGDLLSGKLVRGKSNFPHTKTVHEMEQEAAQNRAVSAPLTTLKPTVAIVRDEPAAAETQTPGLQVNDASLASRLAAVPEKQISA